MELLDTVFGFLEESEREFSSSDKRFGCDEGNNNDEFDCDLDYLSIEESKTFWDAQYQLLQEAFSRNSSSEKNIRSITEMAMKTIKCNGVCCGCLNSKDKTECRICVLKYIAQQLREGQYNSSVCKSKWCKSQNIPSGEHNYVDVVMESSNNKRGPIRVIIEPNFKTEFEMARGSPEYNKLVSYLPEIFVGKSDKLKCVIKLMCNAAKKCMKDNKMHMGPWRKHKYMQAKWLGTPERTNRIVFDIPAIVAAMVYDPKRSPEVSKFRASMLTLDLHCNAVEVL